MWKLTPRQIWKRPNPLYSLSPETTQRILRLLEWTQEEELTCEETFALLDEYVELADGDAETIMPLVKHHLDGCPDCFEGYDALRRILQNDADTI